MLKNNNPISSVIFGVSGTSLSQQEKDFFSKVNPFGFIVFARNIENPQQLKSLTDEMRQCTGREKTLILIDQEGGRVQRMTEPHWKKYPAQRPLGDLYKTDKELAKQNAFDIAREIAGDLTAVGINVDCLPLLDVPISGADDIIGDRAFSTNPDVVAMLGKSQADGLLAGKVLPIIKHIPGHGRAMCDSHLDLPVVDTDMATLQNTDFKPFKANNNYPMAMTAHIIFNAIDDKNTITQSKTGIDFIRNEIGFKGLIMTDDLSMKALKGSYGDKTKACLNAGCDLILHCNGEMNEMAEIAENIIPLNENQLQQLSAMEKLV
ncbi:MAG: beta-N-acetylhexosaminidase [Alphaproteobacteria bacterium]